MQDIWALSEPATVYRVLVSLSLVQLVPLHEKEVILKIPRIPSGLVREL